MTGGDVTAQLPQSTARRVCRRVMVEDRTTLFPVGNSRRLPVTPCCRAPGSGKEKAEFDRIGVLPFVTAEVDSN